jgi:hypothetical protein
VRFNELQPGEPADAAHRGPGAEPPFSDREVPMDPAYPRMSDAMHAWLDGEAPASSVRLLERSRDVDFWNRLTEDFSARRSARPRAGFAARVMAAIPRHPTE